MAWLIFFQHRNSQFQECCDFTYGNRLWREFALSLAANRLSTTCAFCCFRQLNIVQTKHGVFCEEKKNKTKGAKIIIWAEHSITIIKSRMLYLLWWFHRYNPEICVVIKIILCCWAVNDRQTLLTCHRGVSYYFCSHCWELRIVHMATDCDESLHFHLLWIDCQLRVHFVVLDNSILCKQSTAYFAREVILLFLAFSGGSGIPV